MGQHARLWSHSAPDGGCAVSRGRQPFPSADCELRAPLPPSLPPAMHAPPVRGLRAAGAPPAGRARWSRCLRSGRGDAVQQQQEEASVCAGATVTFTGKASRRRTVSDMLLACAQGQGPRDSRPEKRRG
uniref:Uncharacterized protein n=1 Tax=Myotis myotis TaxID=51298 RepID=A0A7J7WVQ2_MYOMY|nr:hypothetical protein mMyoMyo1_011865 [Myotis myotis]